MVTLEEAIANLSNLLGTYQLLSMNGRRVNADLAENAQQTHDWLCLLRDILNSGDCNDCKNKNSCSIAPKPGQQVRYNCAFYQNEKDECEGCEFFTDNGCAPDEYDFSDDYCLDDDIEMEMTGND